MIWVIGASYAVEYAVKGVYEGTIGRLTEWWGSDTPVDRFYAEHATDYGAWMHHTPWYAYPYVERRAKMPAGLPSLRGLERQVAYGAELTAKGWWGWAMGGASESAYGVETGTVRAWVRPNGVDVAAVEGVIDVEDLGEGAVLASLTRYEPFTAAVVALVDAGVEIVEIAGGHRLVVQIVAPTEANGAPFDASLWGDVVIAWPLLTEPDRQRIALEIPVHRLDESLPALVAAGAEIEHLYDY